MSVEIHQGDIFEAPVDIIIQQCNCMNTMGSGIAAQIKKRYPRAAEVDAMTKKGDHKKLSQFTVALADEKQDRTIINLYSQYKYGREKGVVYTNYIAMAEGLKNIREWLRKMDMQDKTIGFPYGMGAGLGGGDWSVIEGLIRRTFDEEDSKFNVLICKK